MYTPLPNSLTIKSSKIHGLGIFALEYIPAKTCLGVSHVEHSSFENDWIRTPLGGFYNHSETPNCKIVEDKKDLTKVKILYTIKNIKIGEELTCTYTIYNIENAVKDPERKWNSFSKYWLGL